MSCLPITVLSGFLGASKTMHLNQTEARSVRKGGNGYARWADLPDPFPLWQGADQRAHSGSRQPQGEISR